MSSELLHQIALTMVPNVGCVMAKKLVEHFGDTTAVFKANGTELRRTGITDKLVKAILSFKDFSAAEEEIAFIEKYGITPVFFTEKTYPQRMLSCFDPPVLLYFKGNAPLNQSKIVSIVGTRANTAYGKKITEQIVEGLAAYNVLIVSGLAYGIDTIAHKAALQNNLCTIGVMANGLQTIYPAQNKKMAKEMLENGGLLTEFTHNTQPDKFNFPRRNRIVAAMADATIVVETSKKGGSMITAEIAGSYGREIFAVPGKTSDEKSAGCNFLIQTNRAALFSDVEQFLYAMNWDQAKRKPHQQRILFPDLTKEEQQVVDALRTSPVLQIDELQLKSRLSSSELAGAILTLELANIVLSLPGKTYQLI